MKSEHLSPTDLFAYIDRDGMNLDNTLVSQHLATCHNCNSSLQTLRHNSRTVTMLFGAPEPIDEVLATDRAWAEFENRRVRRGPAIAFSLPKHFRFSMGLPAVVAILLSIFLCTTSKWRAVAQDLLNRFRLEHIAVTPVQSRPSGQQDTFLRQFLSDVAEQIVIEPRTAGESTVVHSQNDAAAMAGFAVRLLPEPTTSLRVSQPFSVRLTLNADRLEDLLADMGNSPKAPLPPDLDTTPLRIAIPPVVTATYGDCYGDPHLSGSPPYCLMLIQAPGPIVDLPPGIDARKFVQMALQFLGMPPSDVRKYLDTIDWRSTLVIPIRSGETSATTVPLGDSTAILLRSTDPSDHSDYMLAWTHSGIFYALYGVGDNASATAIAMNIIATP